MNIYTGNTDKLLYAEGASYLTLNLDIEDSKLPLVKYVTIPITESIDQWIEIGEDRALAIMSAKKASSGEAQIQTEQFNQQVKLVNMVINDIELTDEQAIEVKGLFPKWETLIGQSLSVGYKLLYNNQLYKVIQQHVALNDWLPSITASLYALVSITTTEHAGTKEDPIPYEQMMLIENGKYYTQDGVLYVGIMDAPNGYPNDLKDLHTLVQKVEE